MCRGLTVVVNADMLHLVVYYLVWGKYMLVGEVAMLESVVALYVEAMSQASIEIPSYLGREGYILRLLGREHDGVAESIATVVEGSRLRPFISLRGEVETELSTDSMGEEALDLKVELPNDHAQGIGLDDGPPIKERVELGRVGLGCFLCQHGECAEAKHKGSKCLSHKYVERAGAL